MTLDMKAGEVADALTPVIRRMVRAEAERIAARPSSVEIRMDRVEAEIMIACKAVAQACDELAQARFAGAAEIPARRKLERTADRLGRVMKRHGRMK